MNHQSLKKTQRLLKIIKLFSQPGIRLRVSEIRNRLGVTDDVVYDDLSDLSDLSGSGLLPLTNSNGEWYLTEGAVVPKLDVALSHAEAVSLYLAGRLLVQTQSGQNWHVTMALQKLLEALPGALQEQQQMFAEMLSDVEPGKGGRRDLSQIFYVLACGWVSRRQVRLVYSPPRSGEFECLFDPYMLEPSAIGRTVYAMGLSSLAGELRTYKLERIVRAELTKTEFTIPASFQANNLLKRAWGVMYGEEEPVEVRVRFTASVVQRVYENQWHPSEQIIPTQDGCEWCAWIGDTLEIEPWLRGWGADCEVLAPVVLRKRMMEHVNRAAKVYGLNQNVTVSMDSRKFNANLFKKQGERDG